MSNSLQPHGLQHTRLPRPSPSPGDCSDSSPLSRWTTISPSVVPSSPALGRSLASGSFPLIRLFHSGGQSMGASASVLPVNIQGWFPLGLLYVCFMFLFSCQFYSAVWGTQSPRVSQARSNSHPYLCFWLSYLLFCCCWQKDIRLLVGESASNQP